MKNIERFLKEYREEIHRSAAEMFLLPLPDVTEELFGEFERTGERLAYEKVYFTRRKYLAILGMEAILQAKEGEGFRKNLRKGMEAGEQGNQLCNGKQEEGTGTGICAEEKERTGTDSCADEEERNRTGICADHEEIIKKLCAVIESVCGEETWALPAHVNRKAEGWKETVDLFASETAQTLANLMDELWEKLPGTLTFRMQEEIRRRVLDPFFESEVPYSWWEGSEMNWNAVCAGAIGSVCIHFNNRGLALPAEFSACIRRICGSLTHYIDGFSDDGVCMEGLGYYTYGMAFYVNFMRELEEVFLISDKCSSDLSKFETDRLHSDSPGFSVIRLLSNPSIVDSSKSLELIKSDKMIFGDEKFIGKLRRIAEFPGKCFFTDGRSLSFSDGDSRDTWRVGIWCALSTWFDGLPLPNLKSAAGVHADSCYRFVNLKMDIFETEKYLEKRLKQDPAANKLYMADREKRTGIADTCFVKSVSRKKAAGTRYGGADESVNRAEVSCLKLREMDCVGNDENIKLTEPHGRACILTSAQWCIAESANGVGFACKGGYNDEPHNHNDIGHFIYESGGTVFLADLGAGEYTAEYFGAKRYQILCNSSVGHSVPVLNGENQRCGREYRCGGFVAYVDGKSEDTIERKGDSSCRADVLCKGKNGDENISLHNSSLHENKTGSEDSDLNTGGKIGEQILHVQMAIGSAWPQKEGTPAPSATVRRTFHFNLQTGRLEIEDTFSRTQWETVSETLITQIPPQVEGTKVYLRGDGGTVVISLRDVGDGQRKSAYSNQDESSGKEKKTNIEMEGEIPKIRVQKLEHRNHVGETESVYAICRDVSGSHARMCIQKT